MSQNLTYASTGLAGSDKPANALRVLVVEDEEVIRMLTDDILSEEGFTVSQVKDATEGLQYLCKQSHLCDLVLVDVRMPGPLDGIDFCSVVEEAWPHISIVIVSGYHTRASLPRSAVLLQKPWRIDMLLAAVHTAQIKRRL